jgi:uncharacterized MAPEG superfamily protein
MPLYFWSILVAGLLPYAAALIAKSRRDFDNANPRAWLAKQEGFRARAHAAQLNSFEAFPLFAAAVIVAHLRGAPEDTIAVLCGVFLAARIAYIGSYIANLAPLRSLVWLIGMVSTVALFFVG